MAGVPVACHAHGCPGLLRAVRADVDTIEHGVWLDQSCVGEMARRGTRYVRTLAVYHWHATRGSAQKQARSLDDAHRRSLVLALDAGVRVALGTDSGSYGHGGTALALELIAAAGVAPAVTLATGTRAAAECLGLARERGTLGPGKAVAGPLGGAWVGAALGAAPDRGRSGRRP